MKTAIVIPARGGSKGIPRKNITLLAGRPVLEYSVDIGKRISPQEVYVSTEDKEIQELSLKLGVHYIARPIALSSDTATDYDWLQHAFRVLPVDNIVILRPTTPIRCASTVLDAIRAFEQCSECDSLRSAHEAPESPYKWFELNRDDNYWKKNAMADLPRQSLPSMFIPNGYVDITKRRTVENGSAYGDKILSYITMPVVELDTMAEFDYLEYQLNK